MVITGKKLDTGSKKFLFYFAKIIKKIFRANFFDAAFEQHYTIFNTYLCEILPFMNTIFDNFIYNNKIYIRKNSSHKNINHISKSDDLSINKIKNIESVIININLILIVLNCLNNNKEDDIIKNIVSKNEKIKDY